MESFLISTASIAVGDLGRPSLGAVAISSSASSQAQRPFKTLVILMNGAAVRRILLSLLLVTAFVSGAEVRAAQDCPTPEDEIEVDRPDVTNSSVVVPVDSLQLEDGINITRRSSSTILDGTNSRLRLGVADCLEVLLDVPDYNYILHGTEPSGFSDIAPAVKKQIGPLPGNIELSATLGLGLPTGTTAISGRGYQPYLQFPWSHPIAEHWEITGMLTSFWSPSEAAERETLESTFSLERDIGARADCFVEFVGDYPSGSAPRQFLNFGGAFRITRLQQLDFHTGFGLDNSAPKGFFGIGYSWRWDRL
jgi:Putative MetA-pathway of phenol degradation